ncbi:hypothetical protein IQ254_27875 [Nodosilinea sp. LEGE 07088]|uniref:DNA methyltransferase n=1 Tax=Nodosilinea sp. LEGE 07088 TaxID=2777968 RepID=UPI00188142B7|nr:DNA methyltransferase [Nodosilinea sp. LEGE 07088]MBE9140974.1 hypothetical protein [Nodosilinea sp. LEGE 07088]
MGLTVAKVQTRLARFEFEALFVDDLGWLAGPPTEGDWPGDEAQRSWVVAHSPTAGKPALVVEMEGQEWRDRPLPEVFQQLRSLAQRLENGLVIWRDGANQSPGQRSLWCWANGESDHADWGSQVVVHGEVSQGWATRLLSLHRDRLLTRATLYPLPAKVTPDPVLVEGFHRSWQALIVALPSLPGASRLPYATLLLSRLIAIAALQQRGYLGRDEWYLQNQFGQSQQRGIDSFFAQVLQPLWQQGFTLPDEERAPGIRKRFGPLPFLPTGPFRFTELDQKWGHMPLPDAAFEPTLNWLADLLTANPSGLDRGLGELLEQAVNEHDGAAIATPAPLLDALCDRTICATVLDRAEALTGQRYQSIDHLLLEISPTNAGALLQIIGRLTLLDPACGSGRFLVAALERLMDLTQGLRAIARLDSAKNVPNWAQPSPHGPALGLYQHLTERTLYGLDLWPPAVELARLQLWLCGVRHTTRPTELTTLPDLTLSLFQGNALMGLIRVDDERFDQVQPKRRAKGKPTAEAAPLQGNLLQPLMADSYEAILAERQVRLEHYRSQTQLLAEVGSVPAYAQADFLRDRLDELNQIAQGKLTYLLWSEGSQQLGLRVPDPGGSRPTRPLSQADVEATQPFHWGFYFHRLLRDQGGFDMVLSHFPRGAVEATRQGFVERYLTLFEQKDVAPSTFLHNHSQVLTIDPDLTQTWAEYRGQFTWLGQYLRRSEQYPHSSQGYEGKGRLYWSRLFLERSLQLLRPGGRCAVLLDPFWDKANGAPLRHWLLREARVAAVVDLSNHQGLWPTAPSRTTLCALWLQKAGSTPGSPYTAHAKDTALAPEQLAAALKRLTA